MIIVAVKDHALDAFNTPFFVPTEGVAVRSFKDEVNRPESPMGAHPEDYDLYKLGEYDERRGAFNTHEPLQIARAKNFKE